MKRSGPIKRRAPLAKKKAAAIRRRKKLKASNAYMRPEWVTLKRQVRKRSGGVCELRLRCDGAPAQGDCHHHRYQEGLVGWQRLIVPIEDLSDTCYDCHKAVHTALGGVLPFEEDFLQ